MAIDRLFLGNDSPWVEEIDPADVSQIWQTTISDPPETVTNDSAPAVYAGGDNGQLIKLDGSGAQQYDVSGTSGDDLNQVRSLNGYVFAVTDAGQVKKFNASDGSEVTTDNWPQDLAGGNSDALAVYDTNLIYAGDGDGYIYEIDFSTGAINTQFSVHSRRINGIKREGDVIICCSNNSDFDGTSDPNVFRVNTALDTVMWSYNVAGTIEIWEPDLVLSEKEIVAGGINVVAVLNTDGTLARSTENTGSQSDLGLIREIIADPISGIYLPLDNAGSGANAGVTALDYDTLDQTHNRSFSNPSKGIAAVSSTRFLGVQFDDANLAETGVEYQVWDGPDPQSASVVDAGTDGSITDGFMTIYVSDASLADGDSVYVLAYVTDGGDRRGWSGETTVKSV